MIHPAVGPRSLLLTQGFDLGSQLVRSCLLWSSCVSACVCLDTSAAEIKTPVLIFVSVVAEMTVAGSFALAFIKKKTECSSNSALMN